MNIRSIRTGVFKEGQQLAPFVKDSIKTLREGSIVVVTSKIVALSEGRVRAIKNTEEKEKLIKSESQWAMRTKYVWLTIKDNSVMASAGIDESNADGKVILLPSDSHAAARKLRANLRKHYGLKNLGVVITDSRLLPFRGGVAGVALGYSGFSGIRDYAGQPDIFGRKLQREKTDVADSLATAAVLTMGEGNEQRPLAVVAGAPVVFTDHDKPDELAIDIREDVYQPLLERIKKIHWKKK